MSKQRRSSEAKRKIKAKKLGNGNGRCHYCGAALTMETATLEHVKPLSKGGTYRQENIVLACRPCNSARGNGSYEEFKAKMLPLKQGRKRVIPEGKIA